MSRTQPHRALGSVAQAPEGTNACTRHTRPALSPFLLGKKKKVMVHTNQSNPKGVHLPSGIAYPTPQDRCGGSEEGVVGSIRQEKAGGFLEAVARTSRGGAEWWVDCTLRELKPPEHRHLLRGGWRQPAHPGPQPLPGTGAAPGQIGQKLTFALWDRAK